MGNNLIYRFLNIKSNKMFLEDNINNESIYIDIGCNNGYTALYALKLGAKEVFAIDANQNHVNNLKKKNFKNLTLTHKAVYLKSNDHVSLNKSIESLNDVEAYIEEGRDNQIPTITLSDYLESIPYDKNLIVKIDIEGSEKYISEDEFKLLAEISDKIHFAFHQHHFTDDNPYKLAFKYFRVYHSLYGYEVTDYLEIKKSNYKEVILIPKENSWNRLLNRS